MDHRRTENFYVVVSPGLEKICAKELTGLGINTQNIELGGVEFSGKLRDLYMANLWLRTASRILVRFADFQCRDFPILYRRAKRLPWGRFIKPEVSLDFRVTCHNSRLNHTARIAETLESAVNQALGRSSNPTDGETQRVLARIVEDQMTLSIDSSGDLLHRRGYRQSVTKAPLRETLAAGVLFLLGWDGSEPLSDPMCGSGSIPIEAAMLASHIAPGLNRVYSFMTWPGYRDGLWKLVCDEAQRSETALFNPVRGADENTNAVKAAQENCQRAGLDKITINAVSLDQQTPQKGQGLVICNPPYGKRLSLENQSAEYYRELGKQLTRVFPDWRKAMICPDIKLIEATMLPFRQIASLDNGGIRVGLFVTAG